MPDKHTNEELEEACSRLLAWGDVIHGLSERGILDGMIARALPAKLDRIAELGKIIDLWAVSLGIACEDRDKLKHANRELETQLRVAREISKEWRERFCTCAAGPDGILDAYCRGQCRACKFETKILSALSPQKETEPQKKGII